MDTVNSLDFDGPLQRASLQPTNRQVEHFLNESARSDMHLDAPYQRSSVWTLEQKQNLIRSLLLELPVGSILINARPDVFDGYNIIDGKQRIEAIRDFVDDKFPIPASWVPADRIEETEDVSGWPVPGLRWSGTTLVFKRLFRRAPIPAIEARVATIAEEAAIFRLINSAGTAQTPETLAAAASVETAGQ